jgi:hypothetical protein
MDSASALVARKSPRLSVNEVKAEFGIGRKKLSKLEADGQLSRVPNTGKRIAFYRADLERFSTSEPHTVPTAEFARRLQCSEQTVRKNHRDQSQPGPHGVLMFRQSYVDEICRRSGRVTAGELVYCVSTEQAGKILRCKPNHLHLYLKGGERFGSKRRYSREMVLDALAKRGGVDLDGIAFLLKVNQWQASIVEKALTQRRYGYALARDGSRIWRMADMASAGVFPYDHAKFQWMLKGFEAAFESAADREPTNFQADIDSRKKQAVAEAERRREELEARIPRVGSKRWLQEQRAQEEQRRAEWESLTPEQRQERQKEENRRLKRLGEEARARKVAKEKGLAEAAEKWKQEQADIARVKELKAWRAALGQFKRNARERMLEPDRGQFNDVEGEDGRY